MRLKGRLIEYIDHGRFLCGLVVDENEKRIRILNQNGREINLPLARAIHISLQLHSLDLSREERCKVLQSTAEKRQQMMTLVDLEEIWKLVIEEDELLFTPEFLSGLCFGEDAADDHIASFLRCIFEDPLFFKYRKGKIVAHVEEVVEQLRIKQKKRKRKRLF